MEGACLLFAIFWQVFWGERVLKGGAEGVQFEKAAGY